jgi:hypothetical protein
MVLSCHNFSQYVNRSMSALWWTLGVKPVNGAGTIDSGNLVIRAAYVG